MMWTKIECIRITKQVLHCELRKANGIVEAFLKAYNIKAIEELGYATFFMRFLSKFQSNEFNVDASGFVVYGTPKEVSVDDIRKASQS